jgi:hypothetical protein
MNAKKNPKKMTAKEVVPADQAAHAVKEVDLIAKKVLQIDQEKETEAKTPTKGENLKKYQLELNFS